MPAIAPNYLYYRHGRWGRGMGPTANTEYWIPNRIEGNVPPDAVAPEDLPEGAVLFPDFARGPRPRASNDVYWFDNFPQVDEALPDGTVLFPDFARGPRPRAANAVYWLDNLLATPEFVVEALPEGVVLFPDFARAARRAANEVYWIPNLPQIDEALPEGKLSITWFARAHRRAANDAYWIPNRNEGNIPSVRVEVTYTVDGLLQATIEITYTIDAIIGSPAVGFQQKQLVVKRMIFKELQFKDLIGPS